ncbi:MAG TPA: hypothetical protein VLK27_02990 [Chthoniobacterales bacterium]|nr:hypothetical protein [Chthoniobacterales bacterium]
MKLSSRSSVSGQGFVVLFILLAICGGIIWYLYSTKAATQRDGIRYGHDVIDRLVNKHDASMLDTDLASQAKMEMPPSQRAYLMQRFAQFGVPSQPIQIDDNVSFDTSFFGLISANPHGIFTAHLNYPAQPVTLQLAISQGATKWLIENITISMGNNPQ